MNLDSMEALLDSVVQYVKSQALAVQEVPSVEAAVDEINAEGKFRAEFAFNLRGLLQHRYGTSV